MRLPWLSPEARDGHAWIQSPIKDDLNLSKSDLPAHLQALASGLTFGNINVVFRLPLTPNDIYAVFRYLTGSDHKTSGVCGRDFPYLVTALEKSANRMNGELVGMRMGWNFGLASDKVS